jgi:hypothetical protein
MPKIMLDGKLFDTETATFICQCKTGPDFWQGNSLRYPFLNLYRTPKGAFFASDEDGQYRTVSEGEARRLVRNPEKYQELFGDIEVA